MSALQEPSSLRKYEGVLILNPDLGDEDQKAILRKNREVIKSFKGDFHHLDTWGKRRLANPIEKYTRGIYIHYSFEADPSCVSELERTMRINDKVLRFNHTRLDDRVSLSKHIEAFKSNLEATLQREKERESKFQARKAAQSARRPERSDRPDRPDRPERGDRSERFDRQSDT